MGYLSIMCISTNEIVTEVVHKQYKRETTNKTNTSSTANEQTNIITFYDLPINSELIRRVKQYCSNNIIVDSPSNRVS